MSIAALKKMKVKFGLNTVYEGIGDKRKSRPGKYVDVLILPLTPADWCSLCMSEGGNYMGGCCGNMSHAQDLLSSIFRFGPWVTAQKFTELIDALKGHDGFEALKKLDKKTVKAKDPWSKIIRTWHAAKDVLKGGDMPRMGGKVYGEDPSSAKDAVSVLDKTLWRLSWASLRDREEDATGQRHANREATLMQVGPALKTLSEKIQDLRLVKEPLEGFAVVEAGTSKIVCNGLGFCIYRTKEAVDELLEAWNRVEGEDDPPNVEVRPIKIGLDFGVQFTDGKTDAPILSEE